MGKPHAQGCEVHEHPDESPFERCTCGAYDPGAVSSRLIEDAQRRANDGRIAFLRERIERNLDEVAYPMIFVSGDEARANFKIGMRIESSADGVNYEPVARAGKLDRIQYMAQLGFIDGEEAKDLLEAVDEVPRDPTSGNLTPRQDVCECFAAHLCDEHRPISVGDYVRWETDRLGRKRWIEGEVNSIMHAGDGAARISVDRSDGYQVGREVAVGLLSGAAIRRVPRPARSGPPVIDPPRNPTSGMLVPQNADQWRSIFGRAAGIGPYSSDAEVAAKMRDLGWSGAWDAIDPLDVKHDGVKLRDLVEWDQLGRQEKARNMGAMSDRRNFSPVQRAAVSAHWSAELRARVAAAKAKERERVVLDLDAEDL